MMQSPASQNAEPTPLARKLAARIAAAGPISFYDYMEACLYDPKHGYYRKQGVLGRCGDFITAPEISQVFGELTGLWAGESWRLMGQPSPIRLIELGPGRGALMADALRALRVLPAFLKSVAIHLIETSRTLRAAQEAALAAVPCPVFWHENLAEVPGGATIAIANEFIDCLPVRQFVYREAARGWHERMVAFEAGHFRFELSASAVASPSPQPSPLAGEGQGEGEATPSPEDGAILEVRPGAPVLLHEFAARAAAAPFAALIVDYGYSVPSYGDTVQAVRQHRFAGVFEAPGETDLTAHTDFAGLVQAATQLNLTALGPMPMGEWLLRLGLEARVRQLLSRASEAEAADIQSRVTRLVDPKQMGVLFKALVLTGGGAGPLPPF